VGLWPPTIEKEELVPITRLAEIAREVERALEARGRGPPYY